MNDDQHRFSRICIDRRIVHIILPLMHLGIDAGNKKSIDSMVIIGGLARFGACYIWWMSLLLDLRLVIVRLAGYVFLFPGVCDSLTNGSMKLLDTKK